MCLKSVFLKYFLYSYRYVSVYVRARSRTARAEEFREFHRVRRRSVKVFMFVVGRRTKNLWFTDKYIVFVRF